MANRPSGPLRQAWRPILVACALVFFALPSWPATVDDVYITLTYARHWAESGQLEWTTGERVEGYSNFLFMALMAALGRAGFDIDVAAQLLALGSALVCVLWVERRTPRSVVGMLILVALVAWAPLDHWASIGMETTTFALLVMGGWVLVAGGGWGAGVGVLALASITRPEGVLHLGAALVIGLVSDRAARHLKVAGGALVILAGYHGVRAAWFGHFVPSSYLVKISPIGLTKYGFMQLAGDVVTASGIIAVLGLFGRLSRRDLLLSLTPFLIQAATLVRASGDWMAWGRLVVPGVVAAVGVFVSRASWVTTPSRVALGTAFVFLVLGSSLEPRGYGTMDLRLRDPRALVRSVAHVRHGLDTPVAEDVAWVVDEVPDGATALVVDAGILGDIPGVRLLDARGLSHRPAAEATAANASEAWMKALLASEARPELLRLANWEGTTHPDYPDWLTGAYSLRADLRYGGGSIRWYATTEARPSSARRAERWEEMLRRHPSHPFLWWHAALSASADGASERAVALCDTAGEKWPSMAEFDDCPASLSFTGGTDALEWERGRGFRLREGQLVSRPVESGRVLVQGSGEVEVVDPCAKTIALDVPGELPLVRCAARPVTVRTVRGEVWARLD